MSKNITIQEGGVAKQMTVEKLKTNLVGGGTCLWVPEDDVILGQKSINENGTYAAADDGFYGYSQVTVHGIGAASGKIPSGATVPSADGNEYIVSTDNSGNLDFLKIPSSIEVTTLPTKTEYVDGETIDYTGMVVTAYDANGQSMGTVPLSELILPMTTAYISSVTDPYYENAGGTIKAMTLKMIHAIGSSGTAGQTTTYHFVGVTLGTKNNKPVTVGGMESSGHTAGDCTLIATRYNNKCYMMRISPTNGLCYDDLIEYDGTNPPRWIGSTTRKLPYNTFTEDTWQEYITYDFPVSTADPRNVTLENLTPKGGGLEVPVKWPRTGDGTVLETSFLVSVAENPEGEITLAEVDQAITIAQLVGLDVVYIRGVEYTMADAISLRNSLS